MAPPARKRTREALIASRKRVKTSSSTAAAPVAEEAAVTSRFYILSSNLESLCICYRRF
jgi:hypothetical protein